MEDNTLWDYEQYKHKQNKYKQKKFEKINSGKIVIEHYIRNVRFQFGTKNRELNVEKTMMTGII